MGSVTAYTADYVQGVLNGLYKTLAVNGVGHLIATKFDNSTTDLGLVKGADGTNGVKGDKGDTGLPGTAGVWFDDNTVQTVDPVDSTYKTLATLVIPSVSYNRYLKLDAQVSLVALSTGVAVYRGAIRDNTSGTPATVSHLPWYCTAVGLSGHIPVKTRPIFVPSGTAKTYIWTIRRDSGSGGQTDGDELLTNFSCFATPA